MVNTIDIGAFGAQQARLYRLFSIDYPLPLNAEDFPLSASQMYGQVATNARLSDSKASTNKSFISRSHHVSRSDITELSIALPNWYWDVSTSKLELPNGGGIQYTASIEYPAGTFHQIRFNGQVRGFCQDFHQLVSDFAPVEIPSGQSFWINVWCLASGGTILFQNTSQNAANGEKLNSHATLATDQTLTGVSGSAQTIGFWPTAIIGRTTVKPVLVIGDSLQRGIGDTNDGSSAVGLVPRALASTLPYINLGGSGDSIALFLQSYAKRIQMGQYIRNIVAAHGTNDIRNGRTITQIKTDLISYWRLLKNASPEGTRVFQCTLTHSTLSTDSWATPDNQTASPNFATSGSGTRELINDWLRDGAPILEGTFAAIGATAARAGEVGHPLHAVFDVADVFETARNSGRWKTDGSAGKWTADGIHPTQYAYLQAAASGAIDLGAFA